MSDEIETELLSLWRDVLGQPTLSADADLFDNGSHSIAVLHVHLELISMFNVEIPLLDLLELTTVRQIAARVAQLVSAEQNDAGA